MPEAFQTRLRRLLALSTLHECLFLDFQAQHGANLEPKGSKNGAKIDAKIDLEPKWRLGRAREGLGTLQAPFWTPFWPHFGAKSAAGTFVEPIWDRFKKDFVIVSSTFLQMNLTG